MTTNCRPSRSKIQRTRRPGFWRHAHHLASRLFPLAIILFSLGFQADRTFAAHFVCGFVYDAIDCMDSAWHTVRIYYPSDPATYTECSVNPETVVFCCDVEAFHPDWQIGDTVYAEVIDNGNGYTAGPVSVILSGEGYDVTPPMQLEKDGIQQHPLYPDCGGDTDGDYTNQVTDNCPHVYNPWQEDADGDGIGDACDDCPQRITGDVNGDGAVDMLDVDPFIQAKLADQGDPEALCAANITVQEFVDLLLN